MSVWHEHAWVRDGHVLRCGDPDCQAFMPPPLAEVEAGPVRRPPRKPKPKRPPVSEPVGAQVVELKARRR